MEKIDEIRISDEKTVDEIREIFRSMKRKDKLSKEEFELVRLELATRMKDVIYMSAYDRAGEIIKKFGNRALNEPSDKRYKINYVIQFVAGDIQQVVARLRRTKENGNRNNE